MGLDDLQKDPLKDPPQEETSELAPHQRCPGCLSRGNHHRSCDHPRQARRLEGGTGADGTAEPD